MSWKNWAWPCANGPIPPTHTLHPPSYRKTKIKNNNNKKKQQKKETDMKKNQKTKSDGDYHGCGSKNDKDDEN